MRSSVKSILMNSILIIVFAISCSSKVRIQEQLIQLPVSGLVQDIKELSYVMGVGDLDGDQKTDFVIRVWSEEKDLKNDLETFSCAYSHDGEILWKFAHHIVPREFGFEPCAMVPLTIWDFDGDSKDEVVTMVKKNDRYELVMLGTAGDSVKIEQQAALPEASKFIYSALAYLDAINPYVVIATGRDARVFVFDNKLSRKNAFDNPRYYRNHDCVWLLPYDYDEDGRDELVHGPLLLNEDLTIYFDATQTGLYNHALTGRSFIADIDPDNSGFEWYIHGSGRSGRYHVEPDYWKGPYLLDVDSKELLWHENYDKIGFGWGRMHRGWVHDAQPEIPGLEMFCTGYYWEDDEWQDALDGKYEITPNGVWAGEYWETYKLYSAKGQELLASHGTRVGYPVMWDDDPEPEYFMYRNGKLLDDFFSDDMIAQLAKHNGSGECSIADIRGDWREEIIITDNQGIVHIYSNGEPSIYSDRPSPRTGHNYLMHMASIGNGLPKPVPPDAGWFEIIK